MTSDIFQAFVKHASGGPDTPTDYIATKLAMMKMFPKLAMGLDSHAMLAQSLYHHGGADAVNRMALANPAHRSGILQGVKNIAPAVGGVRTMGSNPLRAVASGVLHTKLANYMNDVARRASQAGRLRPPAQPVKQVVQALTPKLAGMLGHAVELGGLGILARPSINEMRGKPMGEKSKAKHELLGLGALAAPSAYHLLTRH